MKLNIFRVWRVRLMLKTQAFSEDSKTGLCRFNLRLITALLTDIKTLNSMITSWTTSTTWKYKKKDNAFAGWKNDILRDDFVTSVNFRIYKRSTNSNNFRRIKFFNFTTFTLKVWPFLNIFCNLLSAKTFRHFPFEIYYFY